jgi:serine/threonine protein kinase
MAILMDDQSVAQRILDHIEHGTTDLGQTRYTYLILESIFHYRTIRTLGAAVMAEVYLAENIELKRKVALKLLKPESKGVRT